LRECAARLRRLRLQHDSWEVIGPELQRDYGGARRAMRQIGSNPDGRHKWRKRAKVVRYQLGFLEPLWPPVLKTLESELHRLTDCLGEDHDLALLRAKLLEESTFNNPAQRQALLSLIERRRQTLQRNALALGLRIFGEKPHRFSARLRAYWCAWSRQ
jgi:CHAD domain-containing protein